MERNFKKQTLAFNEYYDFSKSKEVNYFISLDGSIEFLLFSYEYKKQQAYIKYKKSKNFIQLEGGANSISSESLTCKNLKNYREDVSYRIDIDFYWDKINNKAFLKNRMEFNFLELEPTPKTLLSTEFIKLPFIKYISYILKLNSSEYFIIASIQFTHDIEIYKVNEHSSVEKLEIKDVQRYRDGGTTNYIFINNDVIHIDTPLKEFPSKEYIIENNEPIKLTEVELEDYPTFITLALNEFNIKTKKL